jgi:hypothetical protein
MSEMAGRGRGSDKINELFKRDPVSYRVDRRSALKMELRRALSEKLVEFLGDFADETLVVSLFSSMLFISSSLFFPFYFVIAFVVSALYLELVNRKSKLLHISPLSFLEFVWPTIVPRQEFLNGMP